MSKTPMTSPLGIRLKKAMDGRKIKESELVAALQRLAPGDEYEGLRAKLSQQMVNYILKGGGERSSYTPFLADALNVPCVWLAFGIGADPLVENSSSSTIETRTERERRVLHAFRNAEDPVKSTIEKALGTDAKANKPARPKKQATTKKPVTRVA